MKTSARKQSRSTLDPRAAKIMKGLRSARKSALKTAQLHRVPIVYMADGKLVRERL